MSQLGEAELGPKDTFEEMTLKAKYIESLSNMALTADKIRYAFKSFLVAGAVAELDTVESPMLTKSFILLTALRT
jgi:hypothetical protein